MAPKYDSAPATSRRLGSIVYKSAGNPDVKAFVSKPVHVDRNTRIIIVMSGINRNADEYLETWEPWAEINNYVVVSPLFDEQHWDGSRGYNFGNVFTGDEGKGEINPRSRWAFGIVEGIVEQIRKQYGLTAVGYDLFGHSAGAQFVHRFLLFWPEAHVRYAIAANAGWYTLPATDVGFPYGLKHPQVRFSPADIQKWTRRNLFLLLGTDDTSREGVFRKTAEADAQGTTRVERGHYMYKAIKAADKQTGWEMIDVPGVGHDQQKMGAAAQSLLKKLNSKAVTVK